MCLEHDTVQLYCQVIAQGMFCGTKYTHHMLTLIEKQQIKLKSGVKSHW